jgi:hypothetical protein
MPVVKTCQKGDTPFMRKVSMTVARAQLSSFVEQGTEQASAEAPT